MIVLEFEYSSTTKYEYTSYEYENSSTTKYEFTSYKYIRIPTQVYSYSNTEYEYTGEFLTEGGTSGWQRGVDVL